MEAPSLVSIDALVDTLTRPVGPVRTKMLSVGPVGSADVPVGPVDSNSVCRGSLVCRDGPCRCLVSIDALVGPSRYVDTSSGSSTYEEAISRSSRFS